MNRLLREILEATVFRPGTGRKLVFLPEPMPIPGAEASNPNSGVSSSVREVFPPDCEISVLPQGEEFLARLIELLPTDHAVRVFVFPSLFHRRFLSDHIRAKFPAMNLGEIILTQIAKTASPGSSIWASLPESFCLNESSRSARDHLAKLAQPRLVMANDVAARVLDHNFHPIFRMCGILLETAHNNDGTVRFFKWPTDENQNSDAEADFQHLLRQGGGKTHFGFVLREPIPVGRPWYYDAYHPDLMRRQEDLAHFGSIQRLGDMVDVVAGFRRRVDANLVVDAEASSDGVIVLEGRNIQVDGTIDFEEARYRATVPAEKQLLPGDICIRVVRDPNQKLVCGLVKLGDPPAASSEKLITLRSRNELRAQDLQILLGYLRSSTCLSFLKSQGLGNQVTLSKLLELPVPVMDEPLRRAVDTLGRAATQFRAWAEELDTVRGSLFDSNSARNARLSALSLGRLAKQRFESAELVDDFRHRVRTRFPHPIAFRWRTVESQHPNLEGYIQILECAEVTATYLATVALVLAKSVNRPIPWLSQLSKRISTTGHGTNMGDWLSILQDVNGAGFADDLSDNEPFVEVTRILENKRVAESLKSLSDSRNDQSHGRGPKGSEIAKAFAGSKVQLEIFLQGVEFLADFPLRFVEETRRDTFRKITAYAFRELVGDHALVPIEHGETTDPEIESRSLYLQDRAGRMHLLRPLLIGRECPICNSWGTFYLDTLKGKNKQEAGKIVIKSMEHGHPCDDLDLVDSFKHWGMIQ